MVTIWRFTNTTSAKHLCRSSRTLSSNATWKRREQECNCVSGSEKYNWPLRSTFFGRPGSNLIIFWVYPKSILLHKGNCYEKSIIEAWRRHLSGNGKNSGKGQEVISFLPDVGDKTKPSMIWNQNIRNNLTSLKVEDMNGKRLINSESRQGKSFKKSPTNIPNACYVKEAGSRELLSGSDALLK